MFFSPSIPHSICETVSLNEYLYFDHLPTKPMKIKMAVKPF